MASILESEHEAAGNPAVEFARILRRHKGTIVFVFLIVTGVVAVGATTTPPVFKAESSLIVRLGREYVYRPEVGRGDTARTPSLSEMVNSEVEILNSHDLAEQVVEQLGVETLYPELLELEPDPLLAAERAELRFRQALSARAVLESSVIKVAFEHSDPQIAADSVNLLVERFKDKHLEVFGEERSSFLEDQFRTRKEELARAETALAQFKRENGVFDLEEQRVLLLGQRVRLHEALQSSEIQLLELLARIGTLPPGDDALVPPSFLRPQMMDRMLGQLHQLEDELRALDLEPADRSIEEASLRLLDLRLEESELRRAFTDSNRRIESVRSEIAMVEAFLAEAEDRSARSSDARRTELREGIAVLTREIEAVVRAEDRDALRKLEIQRDDHRQRLAELDQQIQRLDQNEKTLRQLERDVTTTEAAVLTYRERVEESRITEQLDREKRINVRVIERASRPLAPTGLSRNLKILLGAFVGLVAGAAAAVFLDLFRGR